MGLVIYFSRSEAWQVLQMHRHRLKLGKTNIGALRSKHGLDISPDRCVMIWFEVIPARKDSLALAIGIGSVLSNHIPLLQYDIGLPRLVNG